MVIFCQFDPFKPTFHLNATAIIKNIISRDIKLDHRLKISEGHGRYCNTCKKSDNVHRTI